MTTPEEIPGVRVGTVAGLDALIVETPQSTAAISLFGGQVISFVPAGGGPDVLWLSPHLADPPTPLRGGTPVCWPYFARDGQPDDVPSHGYARTATWVLTDGRRTGRGVELDLEPSGLDDLDLRLRMTLRIGDTLEHGLHTHNPGTAPATITEALHNYFRVADVTRVRVRGLDTLTYLDKFDHSNPHVQHGDWALPEEPARSDRLYPDAPGTYHLIDPGLDREIQVSVRDGRTAVVWNPGADVAAGMADVGSSWREFVCVEAANAGPDVVVVPPGATHSMWQSISVHGITDGEGGPTVVPS
ncbi:D-hexose-6-phosphate mutarotase [Gordonia insulae]|uniref:Putative glucose-6-phosphate 1-epimerase n=1 Tax=Gordonia insulae TaxID=2420509 RepID=A0A3G8JI71_9ACTN|nr:D-hexose-6-phosphate mutarotase [Gordonia insulae]AZG44212.1 Putative glucose-6-phosphate 1-epimerase [Gordonia insulae]